MMKEVLGSMEDLHSGVKELSLISMVPIQLRLNVEENNIIVWQNPAPSSTRYCRPIRFNFAKETISLIKEEVDMIQQQIELLSPVEVSLDNFNILVKPVFMLTMIDVVNASHRSFVALASSVRLTTMASPKPYASVSEESSDVQVLDSNEPLITAFSSGLKLRGCSATTMSTAWHRTKIWYRMYEKRYSETQNNDNGAFAFDFTSQSVKLMAVRLSCMIFLLEEAKRRDNLEKRQFIKVFRLTEELIKQLEEDISPFLAKTKRQGVICNKTKNLYLASICLEAIRTVVNAINHPALINKYIKFPQNTNERQILKEKFYESSKCLERLVVLMVPWYQWFGTNNMKKDITVEKGIELEMLLLLKYVDVDVTFGGATHDSFIFNNSVIKTHLE
ncbi:hypothetical protein HW555_011014 [Spodoptera exigua]|uniref:Uncharacterized protein n=1 Tax=Spodoptera exigua TaxID=7107 RepID=A0A835GA05_SPOEX|nr:hypothetical protein HW555_011014 [Spodoptera exigua]